MQYDRVPNKKAKVRGMPRKPVEPSQLKAFSPLDGLKMENLKALARKTSIEEIAGGRFIFMSCAMRTKSSRSSTAAPAKRDRPSRRSSRVP
jgi:hypothetical protein